MHETSAPEWMDRVEPESGRKVRQHTSASANSYPLYYFVQSITRDQHWLVFHSERSGTVQLHRMNLADGSTVQMTDGVTHESGWAIWCEPHLDGIFNHLSALDQGSGDVYYFNREELLCVNVGTLENRVVASLPGRIPIGQSHFSPDGSLFAFVDADRDAFAAALERRDRLEAAGNLGPGAHDRWRNSIPTAIKVVHTATGEISTIIDLDFHVHHVLFVDDTTLLVNHVRGRNGMWVLHLDGSDLRELRPADDRGQVCHQVITRDGLLYETSHGFNEHAGSSWFGQYDRASDSWREWLLPAGIGYVHTGNDPLGRFFFIEAAGARHAVYRVIPGDGENAGVEVLYRLNEEGHNDRFDQQRHHAHPFLSPDRRAVFFTDVIDGYSQIVSVDVADLAIAAPTDLG